MGYFTYKELKHLGEVIVGDEQRVYFTYKEQQRYALSDVCCASDVAAQ